MGTGYASCAIAFDRKREKVIAVLRGVVVTRHQAFPAAGHIREEMQT